MVSSFSRVVAISPSTPCLLLDKFTAPEFRKVARELSDPLFPSPSRSGARARARRLCSAVARHRAASYRAQNPILRRRADWSSEPPPRGRSVAPPPRSARPRRPRCRSVRRRRLPAPPAPPEPTRAASCKPCETSRAARLPIRRRIVIRWIKSDLTQVNTGQP